MKPPDDTRKLVEDIIGCWRLEELAGFALTRHGYGNSDVGYGLTYPGDLDPGDDAMPPDSVEIYGGFGEMFSLVIAEAAYLDILAEILRRNGRAEESAKVAGLARRLAGGG